MAIVVSAEGWLMAKDCDSVCAFIVMALMNGSMMAIVVVLILPDPIATWPSLGGLSTATTGTWGCGCTPGMTNFGHQF